MRRSRRSRRRRRRRDLTPVPVVEEAILSVLDEIPLQLTVRQIYYQLVSKRVIPNIIQAYARFDRILVNLRRRRPAIDARIVDRTRPLYHGEARLWEEQKFNVEVWLEKDALSSIVKQVTNVYGCALQVTRGYPSLTVIQDLAERVPQGCQLVLLHLGDHDPSGVDIYRHLSEEAEKRFPNVILEKVALKEEDIKKYNLPPIPAKRTDPRYKKFVSKHGNRAVELDALPPETLLEKVKKAVLRFTDAKAQARVHYETFIDSASSHLVDKALQSLRIQLSEATCACLQEELDEEAFVSGAKERLEKGLKPQLEIPEALRQRILKELDRLIVRR